MIEKIRSVDEYLKQIAIFIPEGADNILRKKLEKLTENQLEKLYLLDLKNPLIAFILAIFQGYFGLDRIYLGQKKDGCSKNICCFISYASDQRFDIYF